MSSDLLTYNIIEDLVTKVQPVCTDVYIGRPKSLDSQCDKFIVIGIPTELRERIKGGLSINARCYGTFTVYCKAKSNGTMNVNAQSVLTQRILDVFPIVGGNTECVNPRVLVSGNDGYGYFATVITFTIRVKKHTNQ